MHSLLLEFLLGDDSLEHLLMQKLLGGLSIWLAVLSSTTVAAPWTQEESAYNINFNSEKMDPGRDIRAE